MTPAAVCHSCVRELDRGIIVTNAPEPSNLYHQRPERFHSQRFGSSLLERRYLGTRGQKSLGTRELHEFSNG